jgi:hypothetical protein
VLGAATTEMGFLIADCGFMESLRSINYDGPFDTQAHDWPFDKKAHDRQNSLNLN